MPYSGIGEWALYTGSFFAGNAVFSAGKGGAAYIGRRKERGERESGKEISRKFCLSFRYVD